MILLTSKKMSNQTTITRSGTISLDLIQTLLQRHFILSVESKFETDSKSRANLPTN